MKLIVKRYGGQMKITNLIRTLSLGAAIFTSSQILAKPTIFIGHNPQVESIFKYTIDKDGIAFQVYSGGCTCKKSFNFIKNISPDGKDVHLTLIRVSPDYCKANIPEGTVVWYSFEELGINSENNLYIENPSTPDKP